MRVLLDTHTFLWLVMGSTQLSALAAAAIRDPVNQVLLSVASIWELAIKTTHANRPLVLSDSLDVFISKWTSTYQLDILPILEPHALEVALLPVHHRDPFDRILIAQSRVESMSLASADIAFDAYGTKRLW
jgi:PIN domain nuclease of toxin-antitoxin system